MVMSLWLFGVRAHWVCGCARMPLFAVVVSRDHILRFC
jgi:hypothetical protein